jgi:uncharacterized protein (DUF1015 family)
MEAASTFSGWVADGTLVQEESDVLYVYRQDFETPAGVKGRVAGVLGALELEEFGDRSGVLPHERTMPGPKEDRLALLEAVGVNISPIYAIYRGAAGLGPFFDALENRPPAARFQDDTGILQRLWVISAPAELTMLSEAIAPGPLVIADGHHRYETALEHHRRKAAEPGGHGSIMCFCVDADAEDLVVLPYNRALKTPQDPATTEAKLRSLGGIPGAEDFLESSGADHPFLFVLPDKDIVVAIDDDVVVESVGERAVAWRALDVVALHEALLPRAFDEVSELRFSKDPEEIRRLVDDEGWDAGVLLRALKAPQVVEVARSGERMPQKASYFWPKAITGLVFRSLR